MMNIAIPVWQWVIENKLEIERILKTILHYFVPNVEVIQYPPVAKFFVK